MKFLRNVFIFNFLLFIPVAVTNNTGNVLLLFLAFLFSWGFLFFWVLGGLWHFIFGTSLFDAIKNFYINNNIKTKVPFIILVLSLFLLPLILMMVYPNGMEGAFLGDLHFVVLIFSWGFLGVYFTLKLAKYIFIPMGIKLEEIFPNINNEKILLIKIFMFMLLPTISIVGLSIGGEGIEKSIANWIILSSFILLIIWGCRILYKFINATAASGSLLTVIIFVVIFIVIIAYISAIPSTPEPTELQKTKEGICEVAPELTGC